MMFARKVTRPTGLCLLILVLFFALGACALAADDPVVFEMKVSPDKLTAPGEVKVSLSVANSSDQDMAYPVTLYDPADNVVGGFGDGGSYRLTAGGRRTWEGTWNVTEAQLDAGEIAYTLKYHLEEDGEVVECTRKAAAAISFTGERVKLTVNRKLSPEVVRSGAQASVVYELVNSGNVALSDIRVKENISRTAQSVKKLAPGEKATLTFKAKIGNADLTSNATITYKAANSAKTLTEKIGNETIPLAKPNLKLSLSTDTQGVNIGEKANLIVTFVNSGNVSYANVSVKDDKKGEIFTNLTIPAGETVVESKAFVLTEPATFKLTATLPDNTGETKTMKSDELTIGVFDPEKKLLLTLNLTCDQDSIPTIPADVTFRLTVTNNSNTKAESIQIYHGDTYIYTIAALAPGASVTLARDARLSQAGKFRFTARVKDALKNENSFDSNTLQIYYAPPTSAPTQVPVVTIAPPDYVTPVPADAMLTGARNALLTIVAVLAVVLGACFLLFAVSTVMRLRSKSKSNAAYDHLELAERRDYTEPSDEELESVLPQVEETYRVDDEEITLPHEKLVKPLKSAQPEAPAVEDMPKSDGEGGYRVSRADADAADEQTQPVSAPAETEKAQSLEQAEDAVSAAEAELARRRSSRRAQRTQDGE